MKILAVTGSSGGHIFPALSFLDALIDKYPDAEALLILPRCCICGRGLTIPQGYKIEYISVSNLKLSLGLKNISGIFRFFKGCLESVFILFAFKPDIVVGFGTLVCIPVIFFAWVFRIKTLLHEQNVIPGRANKLLAKLVDSIAISFPKTQDYLKAGKKKLALTGNPLRRGLIPIPKNNALDFFKLSQNKFTILVMGGSLGSHKVNRIFLKSLSLVSDKTNLQVIHLAGLKDYATLQTNYKNLNLQARLFDFLQPMQYAYSACDLAISRCGATTLSELIFFQTPAIIIPYPFAYRHQLANAMVLGEKGCALIIQEEDLDADTLKQAMESFLKSPDRLKKMQSNYAALARLAADDLLVDAVMHLVNL